MKVIALALGLIMSVSSFAFSEIEAATAIKKEAYEVFGCDEAQYYTEYVCTGAFLSELAPSAKYENAFEVEVEVEENFFLHAIAFADGEVTVTLWSQN